MIRSTIAQKARRSFLSLRRLSHFEAMGFGDAAARCAWPHLARFSLFLGRDARRAYESVAPFSVTLERT